MEDQRLDSIFGKDENGIEESIRARNTSERNRVNPLPQRKRQIKKARKLKRLQEKGRK